MTDQQADRLKAARQIGASADMAATAPIAVLAIVLGVLTAIIMVVTILGMIGARLVSAPATWLGVVVIAVISRMAGWW